MGESEANTGRTEGLAMLDTFARVGAARFDITWKNTAGDKQRFRRGVPLVTLTRTVCRHRFSQVISCQSEFMGVVEGTAQLRRKLTHLDKVGVQRR